LKKIYCVGYPKSGNTWINYICLTLLCVEFDNIHTQNDWPGIYLKSHAVKENENFDTENLLITPVRDYKECVISYRAGFDISKLYNAIGKFKPGTMNYIRPLQIYDSWPRERRLIIYYENLIKKPGNVIANIAKFIGAYDQAISFINNYEYHKNRCMADYNGDCKETKSNGYFVHFHQKILSDRQRAEWDQAVKNQHAELFEKYLTRYVT